MKPRRARSTRPIAQPKSHPTCSNTLGACWSRFGQWIRGPLNESIQNQYLSPEPRDDPETWRQPWGPNPSRPKRPKRAPTETPTRTRKPPNARREGQLVNEGTMESERQRQRESEERGARGVGKPGALGAVWRMKPGARGIGHRRSALVAAPPQALD
eukprot:9482175-Pyramimonas_sp.AAC.1